ncbi:hypothetical protein VDG1235_836 [Verrucomicrobiia bacterium DG1235]|nr:hypothetical protein VDG1235_836 [Verrucomicrobiae bacterium DG1235]
MKHILLGFLIFAYPVNQLFSQSAEQITDATTAFIATLDSEQKKAISLPFDDAKRTGWTNLPVGLAARPGLRYGELSEESRIRFHAILADLFSSQGYLKTTSIMQLDDILNGVYATAHKRKMINDETFSEIEALEWGFNNYYVTIFGIPESADPWAFKFEGHHISINLTIDGDQMAIHPLFFGSDPAKVETTDYAGLRVLSKEEDYGLRLINSLSSSQKAAATLDEEVPEDIFTNAVSPREITAYSGIQASEFTPKQKQLLHALLDEYIENLEHEKAAEAHAKIENSGVDEIWFAWIGAYESGKPHYYMIHTPDYLIEYDNRGFQNDGNHIHTIWREKGNDFGKDLLKEHYQAHEH